MKKYLFFILFLLLAVSITGCASLRTMVKPLSSVKRVPLPAYSGPKAKILVTDFEVKATKATAEISSGLREMLVTALVNSNRFLMVEPQSLSAVVREPQVSNSGLARIGSGGSVGEKVKIADLIITAAISQFEPQASGGNAGVGSGGGVGSGFLGGLLGEALNKAQIVLDITIVDSITSGVLATVRVQGQASDISTGLRGTFMGSLPLAGSLSIYTQTPMEKAIRISIIEAVNYISKTIPINYYKY